MSDSKPNVEPAIVVAQVVEEKNPRLRPTLGSWLGSVVLLLGFAAALLAIYVWNPSTEGDGLFPKCPTFVMTGLHCPGCGSLRAMYQLLHGHLLAALDYNPLMVVLLPSLAYGVLVSSVQNITGRRLPCPVLSAKLAWLLLAVLVLFGILRNVPYYPLTLLAP